MKEQNYQYCPSCGEELVFDDDKYTCVKCLGNYDNNAKLNTTDTIKHLKTYNEYLNYSFYSKSDLSEELYKFKIWLKDNSDIILTNNTIDEYIKKLYPNDSH